MGHLQFSFYLLFQFAQLSPCPGCFDPEPQLVYVTLLSLRVFLFNMLLVDPEG